MGNSGDQMLQSRFRPVDGTMLASNLLLARRQPAASVAVAMGSTTDKISGLANEAAGNVKQGLGKLTGDEKLKAEGKAQEVKGEGQQVVGDAKGAVKDAADTVKRKL